MLDKRLDVFTAKMAKRFMYMESSRLNAKDLDTYLKDMKEHGLLDELIKNVEPYEMLYYIAYYVMQEEKEFRNNID